jgi:hypothetical protein
VDAQKARSISRKRTGTESYDPAERNRKHREETNQGQEVRGALPDETHSNGAAPTPAKRGLGHIVVNLEIDRDFEYVLAMAGYEAERDGIYHRPPMQSVPHAYIRNLVHQHCRELQEQHAAKRR